MSEKEHLLLQIKEGRRTSQRAEAALRAEIESVRKATEKAGALDMRAKQKTLALQEQVKQGWAASETADHDAALLAEAMPMLASKLEGIQSNARIVGAEWAEAHSREEEIREQEHRTRGEEHKKLSELQGRLDRLRLKKEKKEVEKAELERRLEQLDTAREEVTQKQIARASEWRGQWEGEQRSLSAHPSLNNLSAGYAAGPAYRPRAALGYTPRYPSAGARPSQSPTSAHAFHPSQFPQPTGFRPKGRGTGVNASALPFHPSNYSLSAFDPNHHTTSLMPPQLQHRIFVPAVRPRPQPNFHPPPSVVEQASATRSSPTMLSPPAFPPLPGQTGAQSNSKLPAGPSLASIVTRAVLSPNSVLQTAAAPSPPPSVHRAISGSMSTQPGVPISPVSASDPRHGYRSASPVLPATAPNLGQTVSFATPPDRGFSAFSPTGPWAAFSTSPPGPSNLLTQHPMRTATPPLGWRRDSPIGLGLPSVPGPAGAVGQQRRQGSGSSA